MVKFVAIGCSKFITNLAEGILESKNEILAIISVFKENRPNNSYSLEDYAKKIDVKYAKLDDINDEKCRLFIEKLNPTFIISSWHKIIKEKLLNLHPIIGSHSINLPKDKSRLYWILVRGIKKSALSFLQMDNYIDGGDILLKLPYKIGKNYNINTLNVKIHKSAKIGIKKILPQKQKRKANYLRTRSTHDCIIDPKMSYKERLIASFTATYSCVKLIIENKILSIKKCKRIDEKDEFEYRKIIKIKNKFIDFSYKDGILRAYFLNKLDIKNMAIVGMEGHKFLAFYKFQVFIYKSILCRFNKISSVIC